LGKERREDMRRVVLVLAVMALALLLASGVAWAVNKIGTDGPDILRGTNRADNLLGEGGNDGIFGLGGRDNLVGRARIGFWAATNAAPEEAIRTCWEGPATTRFSAGAAQTT
jgi:hypothetical protein